jgi:hypothetical protein
MNMVRFSAIVASLTIGLGAAGTVTADECTPDNWEACKGKPWVIGETMETPIGDRWWPHPIWGEGDEAGSTNWYTQPEVVLRALEHVSEGKVYRLGHDYSAGMPMFGERQFVLRIPATPTGGPVGGNQIVWHDEFLATEIGQVGTQFDGLGHIGVAVDPTDKSQMYFYNGFTLAEIGDPYGLRHLGTEKKHPIVARGILLDFAGDLYGRRLLVELWRRLRDERAFDSEEELVAQIERDVAETRAAAPPV